MSHTLPDSPKFLKSVARFLYESGSDLSDWCIVFPNKRAAIFFRYYLRGLADQPIIFPETMTVGAFLSRLNDDGPEEADNVELMFILYRAYRQVMSNHGLEPREFDRFAFWGDMMLADFNDIDSALADPEKVYVNLERLKEIAANYLSDEQLDVIREIWGDETVAQLSADAEESFWKHIPADKTGSMSGRFVRLWQLLGDIYTRFVSLLRDRRLVYPGLMQRQVMESIRRKGADEFPFAHVAFVGFSQTSNAVIKIMDRFERLAMASFFWDLIPADNSFAGDSGRTVAALARRFPMPEGFSADSSEMPSVDIISVPSNFLQAKVAGKVIGRLAERGALHTSIPDNSVIVLPDANMLPPVLHSLSDSLGDINITMGLQYRQTPFATLLRTLVSMHIRSRIICNQTSYFFEDVNALVSNPQLQSLMPRDCAAMRGYLRRFKAYNYSSADLSSVAGAEQLAPFFADIDNSSDPALIRAYLYCIFNTLEDAENALIERRRAELLAVGKNPSAIPSANKSIEGMVLNAYREATDHIFDCLNRYGVTELGEGHVLGMIEKLLLANMLHMSGTPLSGLQVMGILETRALDFDNVVILSMNERIMPQRTYQRTFIPQQLRRAYGLPTSDDAEREYAYYFYRLLSRSKRVTCIYDGRIIGLKSAGPSRYLLQLQNLAPAQKVRSFSISMSTITAPERTISIRKSPDALKRLALFKDPDSGFNFSASALKKFRKCPLRFYLDSVCRLNSDNDPTEYIDPATYGTVLHAVLQDIFQEITAGPSDTKSWSAEVHPGDLLQIVGNREGLLERIRAKIDLKWHNGRFEHRLDSMPGESLIVADLMYDYISEVLRFETRRARQIPFAFIGAEYVISSSGKKKNSPQWKASPSHTVNVRLDIDRLDATDSGLRFVDYKSGGDSNIVSSIEGLFSEAYNDSNDAAFQLLFYSMLYCDLKKHKGDIIPELYRIPAILVDDGTEKASHYIPDSDYASSVAELKKFGYTGLYLNKRRLVWKGRPQGEDDRWMLDFRSYVAETIDTIFDPSIPFNQCQDPANCEHCGYLNLCRRQPPKRSY